MKAVFVYDHDFIETADAVFSSGAFQRKSWLRYLTFFDELTVIGNKKDLPNQKTGFLNPVDTAGVRFFFVPPIKSLMSLAVNLLLPDQVLESEIRKHDAVIVRMYSELGLKAIAIAKKFSIPYAIEAVGCPWDAFWNHPTIKGKMLAPFAWFRMKRSVRQAPYVIYVTREFLQRRYPTKGFSAYASNVMLPELSEVTLSERLAKMRRGGMPVKIGFIGKIDVKAKGLDVLVQAVGSIKQQLGKFRIVVVGPGDKKEIEDLSELHGISSHMEFKGKLPSDAIAHFLDDIDLYVHPSRQEGLPRSVIEAMSRACPVLASSIAGIPELLDNKFLHTPGDSAMLSKQLLKVWDDLELREDMARTNFNAAKAYAGETLAERRKQFWSNFFSYVVKKS